MRHAICLLLVGIACTLPSASHAQGWTGNVNAFLGAKALEEDDWEPVEAHDEFGALVDFRPTDWPLSFVAGYFRSDANDSVFDPFSGLTIDVDAETTETYLGVRKIWELGSTVRPYIGGGLANIAAEVTGRTSAFGIDVTVSDDDSAIGFWANGGVYWTLGDAFNIGLDLRYSQASVSMLGVDVEAGGGHAGVILGYHW